MKYYGIKLDGKPLGFYYESNDHGDFCVYISFHLDDMNDNIWLVPNKDVAEKAMITNTEWYNACYDTPQNRFLGRNLELFHVDIPV
jgi:hypothetical protein